MVSTKKPSANRFAGVWKCHPTSRVNRKLLTYTEANDTDIGPPGEDEGFPNTISLSLVWDKHAKAYTADGRLVEIEDEEAADDEESSDEELSSGDVWPTDESTNEWSVDDEE